MEGVRAYLPRVEESSFGVIERKPNVGCRAWLERTQEKETAGAFGSGPLT